MKKVIAYLKWFVVVFFIGLFGLLTAWLFYPLWNLTHWKIFWIWEDSTKFYEDGTFKKDYHVYVDKYGAGKETFKVKYKWHALRNRVWNLNSLLVPKNGVEIVEQIVKNTLTRNGQELEIGGQWPEWAGLKYKVKEGQDPWQGWVGDEIDFKYSNVGTSFFWYSVEGKWMWRYSICRKILGKYWFTFKGGTDAKGYVMSIKLQ